jgi:hypothetical protein
MGWAKRLRAMSDGKKRRAIWRETAPDAMRSCFRSRCRALPMHDELAELLRHCCYCCLISCCGAQRGEFNASLGNLRFPVL